MNIQRSEEIDFLSQVDIFSCWWSESGKNMTSKFRQSIFSFDMDMDVDETPKKMKASKLRNYTKESLTKIIDSAT